MPRLFIPFLAVCLVLAACGDGPDSGPAGTSTIDPNDLGPPPGLGGNVLEISPQHASRPVQSSTRSPDPGRPSGVCARVTFAGLPEKLMWFRMVIDEKEVTPQLTWFVSGNEATGGRVCYMPPPGLAPGRHDVVLGVRDPQRQTAAPKQLIQWSFIVVADP